MSKIRIELPSPHPAQRVIYNDKHRFRVLCCGRRFGKTELAKVIAATALVGGKQAVAYMAPTNAMHLEFWESMKHLLFPLIKKTDERHRKLSLLQGSTFRAFSLDEPDRVRGSAFDLVIIDEAATVRDLENAWNNVIIPTLADRSGGALFLSTPKGLNFFHKLFCMQDTDPANWASFRFPTASNPAIKQTEIDLAQTSIPARAFSQEYLAEFLTDGGAVFGRLSEARRAPSAQAILGPVVFGVDWGRQNDFTAIAVLDVGGGRILEVVRFNQIDWSTQRAKIMGLNNRYRPQMILAEANSIGGPNIEALRNDGLPIYPFTTTQASKALIVDSLALAFEQGILILPDDDILMNELMSFTAKRLPSGAISYGAPDGQHDDTVIALALAWYAGQQGRREVITLKRGRQTDDRY